MREHVVVCGCEVRAHAAVVGCDDHAAAAGRVGGRRVVFGADAGGGAGAAQRFGVFVLADRADEDGAVGGEHVLRGRGGVSLMVGGGWKRRD